jgi:ABC-2 type transport system permease protein
MTPPTIPPTTRPPHGPSGDTAAIRLIADREITVRLRSTAFRITTAAMIIIVIALCVVIRLLSASANSVTVGYLAPDKTAATDLAAIGTSLGQTIHITPVPDHATGQHQVATGSLDALLTVNGVHVTAVVDKNINKNLQNALDVLARQINLDQQIIGLGGNPATVLGTAATTTATVQPLHQPYPYQTQQLVLGIVAGILIYVSLLLNGQSVAQGVVEEKSSRVVELLLATIRPWQLMVGKVLGIGVVGLLQILAIGVAGVLAGLATKVLTISTTAAIGTVAWLIAWYLLGFFMYAVVFAGLGALVSRQEDVTGVVAPASTFLIAAYVLGSTILPSDPGNHLIEVLSIVPVFAPVLMPMRLAMGGVPAWEAILAVLLVAALIPALIWVTARVYRNAVLRTGARVKLRHALHPA